MKVVAKGIHPNFQMVVFVKMEFGLSPHISLFEI
jgi:hypothetical protein